MKKLTPFQIEMMKEAKQGFCYDANPREWDDLSERQQMEELVESGLMHKPKNHSGDRYGFYALTEKGKQCLKKSE